MAAKFVNRLIIILVTALLMLLTLVDIQLGPFRALIAIALVAVIPGYALATSIFINVPLGIMEKVAFSFGFSLGLTSLGGLLLNYSPWGIQSVSWVILLGGITLLTSGLTLLRLNDLKEADVSVRVVHTPLLLHQFLLMALAGIVLVGSYLYARAGAERMQSPSLTRMWMTWSNAEYTEAVLRVQNQEVVPMEYRLELSTLYGSLQDQRTILLAPGEVWELHFALPPKAGDDDFVKAELFLGPASDQSYREVFLRLESK